MKPITAEDLAGKSNFELSALYARLKGELANAKPGTYEYEVLVTSLDLVRRTYAARIGAHAPRF